MTNKKTAREKAFLIIQKQFFSYCGDLDKDLQNTRALVGLISRSVAEYTDTPEEAKTERLGLVLGLIAQAQWPILNNFHDARKAASTSPKSSFADHHAGCASLVNITGLCTELLKQDFQP
jgi:hypothetical protein